MDGKHGYYSSLKDDTKGEEDIYVIDTRFGDNDIVIKHGVVLKDKSLVIKITFAEQR